jgi:hypothetical protein
MVGLTIAQRRVLVAIGGTARAMKEMAWTISGIVQQCILKRRQVPGLVFGQASNKVTLVSFGENTIRTGFYCTHTHTKYKQDKNKNAPWYSAHLGRVQPRWAVCCCLNRGFRRLAKLSLSAVCVHKTYTFSTYYPSDKWVKQLPPTLAQFRSLQLVFHPTPLQIVQNGSIRKRFTDSFPAADHVPSCRAPSD